MKTITPALLRRWPLPALDEEGGKHSRGTVLVVGGSREVVGAIVLAGEAALRVGAGRLQLATVASQATALGPVVPEARVIGLAATRRGELAPAAARALRATFATCDAALVGPGTVDSATGRALIAAHVDASPGAALVVDAGVRPALRERRHPVARAAARCRVIATPHAGEMASLMDLDAADVTRDAPAIATEAATRFGIIVVLKGAETFIAAPDGQLLCNRTGNLGLGTSGSGDVLAGAIAGLCARGAEPLQAAAWGVHLHARAGDLLARRLGPLGYLARELAPELPALLASF